MCAGSNVFFNRAGDKLSEVNRMSEVNSKIRSAI
jgi:hypothetical protein